MFQGQGRPSYEIEVLYTVNNADYYSGNIQPDVLFFHWLL